MPSGSNRHHGCLMLASADRRQFAKLIQVNYLLRAAWRVRFYDPIILPDGRKLLTLRDAAEYITALPKAEHVLLAGRDGIAAESARRFYFC
jgi:hypothetical protein